MGKDDQKDRINLPPWVYALLVGVPLAGGGGSMLGSSQASADMIRLEQKVDDLDEKIDELTIAIVRNHANDRITLP